MQSVLFPQKQRLPIERERDPGIRLKFSYTNMVSHNIACTRKVITSFIKSIIITHLHNYNSMIFFFNKDQSHHF